MFMSPLIIATYITCGICLTLGLLHLTLFVLRSERKADLPFSVMSLCAAGGAFAETLMYRAVMTDDFIRAFKTQINFHGILWIALAWFIVHYTGTGRRRLALVVTVGYAFAVMMNILSPFGVLFEEVDLLQSITLPWGEDISFTSGPVNPWRVVADAAWLVVVYLAIESCLRLYRLGKRHRAIFLGVSLLVFLGFAYFHATLSDLGVVGPPPLISFAFLGLILVMSASLIGDLVRVTALTKEVGATERRWRSLLENVQLPVIGIDDGGLINYVNPHFSEVSGFSSEKVLGRPITDIVPEQEREDLRARFQTAMAGEIHPHYRAAAAETERGYLSPVEPLCV